MFGMAAADGALLFSVVSVVEDVLQQHGTRSADLDLESRKAEEAGMFFFFFSEFFQIYCLPALNL